MTAVDRLANAERPKGDRPPSRDEGPQGAGYWHGSATGEVLRWKMRALAAEALVDRLLAALRAWRPMT